MTLGSYTLRWAFTVLLCFKLFHGASGDCGAPPVKDHTNPVAETSGKPGQTVIYTCDHSTDYYEIPNKSTTITCQDDGTWTVIEDFCIRACGAPERIQFAEPKSEALDIYLPNTTVSYKCRPGYVRVPGTKNSVTCLENYKWSTPDEFCKRKSCGSPTSPENGYFTSTDFLFGSSVTYKCNEGFRSLNRLNYRDCQADGTWSNVVPQCEAVICPAPDKPVNGTYDPLKDEYTYLDSITFLCKQPLEVVGNGSISCTATGQWSGATPTCKDVRCSNPVVDNSKRKSGFIGPYKLNSAISFECDKGFRMNGSHSITCRVDSQWDPAVPKCERVSCGDPGTIENGHRNVLDFFIDSYATYACNKGYALTSSVNYRKCQESGIWTGSTPACAAFCKDPPRLHFAVPKEPSGGDRIYFNGTVLHYVCNKGFEISPDKERTITCTGNSWSKHHDFCTPISCGDPEKITNGHVRFSDNRFGSRATYTCEEGYVRNSSEDYRECQADGKWSSPIACIEEHEPKGLSVGIIVVIVLVVAGAVVIFIIILCRVISKKQKRGVYYCDIKADKCVAALKPEP